MRTALHCLATALLAALPLQAAASAAPDAPDAQTRLRDQGFNHSQVMNTAEWLSDEIGSRLTGSPGMRRAEAWTLQQYRQWGLHNVHREGFAFGRGWEMEHVAVRMLAPRVLALHAVPVAWSPSTPGPVRAPIVVAPIRSTADFAAWRGKLRGTMVLADLPGTGSEPDQAPFQRFSSAQIAAMDHYDPPQHAPSVLPPWLKHARLQQRIDQFLKDEGAVARVQQSYSDGGLLHGEGTHYQQGGPLPAVELAAEDYRRLARLAKNGEVVLEIDSQTRFLDQDATAYNIIAEIPGTDRSAGYVLAGAHLDSWAAADGAADNAAGCAMVMEAARMLAVIGIRPRRTIRFALWSGEEQGLLGSKAYVATHLASRPPAPPGTTGLEDYYAITRRFPVAPLADYARLAAYFNLDNGSGRIRGIHAQGNLSAVPALEQLIAPFRALGVERVVAGDVDSTDHELFAAVGLPAFQFVQDPLDYDTRVHHSSIDTYDHLKADDMRQGAVVLAGILLEVANRRDPLPRQALPSAPAPSDPFTYDTPDDLR